MLFDLKGFHVLFVLASLAMFAVVFWWGATGVLHGEGGDRLVVGSAAFFGFGAALVYLGWYSRRSRTFH